MAPAHAMLFLSPKRNNKRAVIVPILLSSVGGGPVQNHIVVYNMACCVVSSERHKWSCRLAQALYHAVGSVPARFVICEAVLGLAVSTGRTAGFAVATASAHVGLLGTRDANGVRCQRARAHLHLPQV